MAYLNTQSESGMAQGFKGRAILPEMEKFIIQDHES